MRRRYYYEDDDDLGRIISGIVLLYLFYLVGNYFTNRANFWKWLIYGVLVLIIAILAVFGWKNWRDKVRREKIEKLLVEVRRTGQEEYIINFINRFGFEGRRGYSWVFRNHFFDWNRINDLERYLSAKLNNFQTNEKQRDIFFLLMYYIQRKEAGLTLESIKKEPQKFANLTGSDFEKLIYRLSVAMGYSTQWIGKSGDQGGDLIANKNGGRLLIQCKCYRDWSTGNDAVQQVVAAMKYHDCREATVITTSYFTPEAIALAKANNVELISKERLQEMLLNHLGESWS